ncbi:RRP8 protein, partial [Atractosteus spatula]|nr:RRP8 protein [Atractosteus spatula]
GIRKSFLRTPQTRGSVPDWSSPCKEGSSDSEMDKAPQAGKKKTKRVRKNRKTAKTEVKDNEEDEGPVEKKRKACECKTEQLKKEEGQSKAFDHRGFTAQVERWPSNPVDSIISYICNKPSSMVVSDFGCGDCKIARRVKNKVHSFDLLPINDLVTVCDMASVCLFSVRIFPDPSPRWLGGCLSLMGTNTGDFLVEANCVLVIR